MERLSVIKNLQKKYQSKFAELIALHHLDNANELESPEYFQLRDEWIEVGNAIRKQLEMLPLS